MLTKENIIANRLKDYEAAVKKIRESTGVSDINEIVQKFATQTETLKQLEHIKSKNERKLMELNEKKEKLQREIEEARFEGVGGTSIKKRQDEVDRALTAANLKHERNKEKLDKINKVLVNSKAGIEHLCEKLADVKIEARGQPNIRVNDDTMVEALIQCEQKLEHLYSSIKNEPAYDDAILKIRGVSKDETIVATGAEKEARAARPGSANRASVMRQSGYGANFATFKMTEPSTKLVANNIRVRL